MINIIAELLLIGYKPAIEVGINISGSCYSTIMQLTVFLCVYERPTGKSSLSKQNHLPKLNKLACLDPVAF
jgi:hypothetical protein